MTLWQALQTAEYPAVLDAVRAQPGWDAEQADAVHAALVAWTERVLAAPARPDDQSTAALFDLIGRLRSAHGETSLEAARPGTAAAWQAFEALLNERAARQRLSGAQREAVLARRHVGELLGMLERQGPLPQAQLREALGLSEAGLSQVLARMDAAGMIVRERQAQDGRTRQVRLSESERERLGREPNVLVTSRRHAADERSTAPHQGLAMAFGLAANEASTAGAAA